MSGSIPGTLPSNLQDLRVYANKPSGDLPSFPSSVINLLLSFPRTPSDNNFTGTLGLANPTHLYIQNNFITDDIIQAPAESLLMYSCYLSNNPLLGNPNIDKLTVCEKWIISWTKIWTRTTSVLPSMVNLTDVVYKNVEYQPK